MHAIVELAALLLVFTALFAVLMVTLLLSCLTRKTGHRRWAWKESNSRHVV